MTHSAYLAQSARSTCDAHGYGNPAQEAEFLSYRELVETLRVPAGREVTFPAFRVWVERHRQSLLGSTAREAAHALFQRYRQWLIETGLFDLNLVAHEWRPLAQPVCDFVVIDEVQDLTNVQLALVLACLKQPGQFLLCGDSNQIVHLPQHLWTTKRRKRSYVDQVLARAEMYSAYQPARRLRVRSCNGHYPPPPQPGAAVAHAHRQRRAGLATGLCGTESAVGSCRDSLPGPRQSGRHHAGGGRPATRTNRRQRERGRPWRGVASR